MMRERDDWLALFPGSTSQTIRNRIVWEVEPGNEASDWCSAWPMLLDNAAWFQALPPSTQ